MPVPLDCPPEPASHDDPEAATHAIGDVGASVTMVAPGCVLEVVEGPDRGETHTFDLGQPFRVLVGKSRACDLRLSDAAVSRRHAAIEVGWNEFRISDLGSTNGTLINDVSVVEAFMRDGDSIRLGNTVLCVHKVHREVSVAPPTVDRYGSLVGASAVMRRLYPTCRKLAAANLPVLIEGETGTGKEVLAETLHNQSSRREAPFLVLDCTAVAPTLIEGELFGHERGAFTGAIGSRPGVFERAEGGTLLIDEIGDLPLDLQPRLLRVLEKGEVTRIGGSRPLRVNVRILAATRRDLDREVQAGRFRDDLYHRVVVARVELPPLRKRSGDVELLAMHFAAQHGLGLDAFPADLLARWGGYGWPGNVRELRNAVLRWVALGEGREGTLGRTGTTPILEHAGAVDERLDQILRLALPLHEARQRMLELFERKYVEAMLERHRGNVTRTAEAAGVARRHLHRLISKHTSE